MWQDRVARRGTNKDSLFVRRRADWQDSEGVESDSQYINLTLRTWAARSMLRMKAGVTWACGDGIDGAQEYPRVGHPPSACPFPEPRTLDRTCARASL
jgi:hypothetical protein